MIKAIPTNYNGVHFESRIEARHAVFMDSLGVPWKYEPQGFEFQDGTRYLPDFELPSMRAYLEVKPTRPTIEETHKACTLAVETLCRVFVSWQIDDPPFSYDVPSASMTCALPSDIMDEQFWWCECPYCHEIDIQWQGMVSRSPCRCCRERDLYAVQAHDTPRIMQAYEAARSAKFDDWKGAAA